MIDLFYLVIGIGFVLSLLVQMGLKSTYARWSRVANSRQLPGANVARMVLDRNGLHQVTVNPLPGKLTDHYDPRDRSISLSEKIYREPSVASAAVAAHETGHAIQDQVGYWPMRLREKMLPVAQFGAQYGPWGAMIGWSMGSPLLTIIGFAMYGVSLSFQLITLPIEFDASRRARSELETLGFNSDDDRRGARTVLWAAALTYVAGSATAMGHLLIIMAFFGRGLLRRIAPTPR